MTQASAIHVAPLGLRFGEQFIPLHLHHPGAVSVTICDRRTVLVEAVATRYEIERRLADPDDVLTASDIPCKTVSALAR